MKGRKNFSGTIAVVGEGTIRLDMDGGAVQIEFADIDKARLIPEL
jgi:ribosome maturation factor RimP